jgi:hypothetical protein
MVCVWVRQTHKSDTQSQQANKQAHASTQTKASRQITQTANDIKQQAQSKRTHYDKPTANKQTQAIIIIINFTLPAQAGQWAA